MSVSETEAVRPGRSRPRVGRAARTGGYVAAAAILAGVAFLPWNAFVLRMLAWMGVEAIVLIGFIVVFGFAGQMVFSQTFFMALGAYAGIVLPTHLGVPFAAAGAIAVVAAVLFAAAVGTVILRLRTFYLAAVTLVFPVLLPGIVQMLGTYTGGNSGISGIAVPTGSANAFTAIVFVFMVLSFWLASNLVRGRSGWAWQAVREDEQAASSLGVNVGRAKLSAFVVASAFGTLGGVFFGPVIGFIAPASFDLSQVLTIVVATVVGGMAYLSGAIVGSALVVWLPYELQSQGQWSPIIYGVLLVAVLRFTPSGLIGGLMRLLRWTGGVGRRAPASAPATGAQPAGVRADAATLGLEPSRDRGVPRAGVRTEGVSVRFGGLQALDDVSLSVPPGRITGLIGPNGAGKTTLFNVLSGYQRPQAGDVWVDDTHLNEVAPHRRPDHGIARTFQHPHVFGELTLLENVEAAMVRDVTASGVEIALQVGRSVVQHREARRRARELLRAVGLQDESSLLAAELPYGRQKLLEIARALALRPRYLLLDEPGTALNERELDHVGDILEGLSAAGVGVLVVEHQIEFVMRICEDITVLDHGRTIYRGPATEMAGSAAVRDAYLGA